MNDVHSGFTDNGSMCKSGKAGCRWHCDYSIRSAAMHIDRCSPPCYEYEPDKNTEAYPWHLPLLICRDNGADEAFGDFLGSTCTSTEYYYSYMPLRGSAEGGEGNAQPVAIETPDLVSASNMSIHESQDPSAR